MQQTYDIELFTANWLSLARVSTYTLVLARLRLARCTRSPCSLDARLRLTSNMLAEERAHKNVY